MRFKREVDLIHGSIGDKMIMFVLPLAATGMLQQFFNAADIAIIGSCVSSDAMAAVGSNSPLITLLVGLFLGLSLGTNVVISNFIGQNNKKGIHAAVETSIIIAVISGLFLVIIGEIFAPIILRWMEVPDKVFDMALLYLRIYIAGMPAVLLYNFEASIFRSRGNTRTPLTVLTVSGIINVFLNLFFVLICHMTVDGVALATVIANLISAIVLFAALRKEKSEIRLKSIKLGFDAGIMKRIFAIGIPAGVQGTLFSFSNIIIQSAINSLGADAMAGSAAGFNIEILIYFMVNAYGQAGTTFIGQNYGAGNPERCVRIMRLCLMQMMIFAVAGSIAILISGRQLLSFFNDNPQVLDFGYERIKIIVTFQILNGMIEVFSGCMRGYGHSMAPAVMSLIGVCAIRIIWVFTVFGYFHTYEILLAVYPISWAVTVIALSIGYIYLKKTALRSFFANSSAFNMQKRNQSIQS